MSKLPTRDPHPITDIQQALEHRRLICDVRGYCGPFLNEDYYNSFPEPVWHGMGDCAVCCNSCNVAEEERKRSRLEAPPSAAVTAA